MLASLLLIGCMEYTVDATKEQNLGADTAEDELLGDGLSDTGSAEDTGEPEEPTIESAVATEKMYANTSGTLYQVDPETGAMTFIGDFKEDGQPVDHFEDIAIDLSGHMYGGTGEYMYLINPNTAEVRAICPLEIDTTALTFTSEGELIIGVDSALYKFNVIDCSMSVLVSNSYYETSGDIVGLPDGFLYWSVRGSMSDKLIKVNPRTGSEEWVGDIGEERLYGMGYANDKLYGFSGSGVIVEIDPQSGWSTFMKEVNNLSWWGATTNPVRWE
jgi:hypothetical protein